MSQPASGALQPTIEFPPDLPVSARRADIEAALRSHQVVVVCGETGSGKTTQLPKIALAMGRGRMNAPPGQRGRLIGHTQPRRIAATSVARRIADELKTPLGEVVGYKVRFNDRLSAGASIKLMTDGILLAETQTDPLLKNYDTLIIDEAHERSLNIDFLLGYLKQILPRRPDLKLIVTSATIDADRFAQHFAMPRRPAAGPPQGGAAPSGGSATGEAVERGGLVPAPVLLVSGRMYPVEQRWRPFEESRDHDLNDAIAEAVDEVWTGRPAGDILIFLPGEREIRDAAEHLRGHLARSPLTRGAEVLPLFARLSQAEQDRVFDTHGAPRIVIATNVAETSLTVPGIKYVIDPGTARVKRYSYRSKVEQLLVEPVSQAAANQRAGRCGRVSDGICIRLYDEKDFAGRPRFTDPEILRSSLAAVILRMKSLHLGGEGGRVGDFPFLDAPSGRAIADGIQLLQELGAMDEAQALTALGHELSRLPLDPRVGRMILAARERGALREVLVIAAALSVQDVRDRPLEQQAQADQAHAKFDDEKSEFSGYLRLWKWLHDARGGQVVRTRREMAAAEGKGAVRKSANLVALPAAQRAALAMEAARKALGGSAAAPAVADQPTHKLSNRQWENLLRQNFISVRRVREWRDIHTQLHTVVAEHKWKENQHPAGYEALHKSLLAGLLGNVGHKLGTRPGAGPPQAGLGPLGGQRRRAARSVGACFRWLRGVAQVPARRSAGQRGPQAGERRRRQRRIPGRARHQVPPPSRCAPEQATRQVDRRRRTGGDHAAVRPRHRDHRAAVAGGGRWPPLEEAVAGAALGKEGAGRGCPGARHAVRAGGLQRPAPELRRGRPAGRARDLHPRGAGEQRVAGRLDAPPAVPAGKPAGNRQGRGTRAQEPAPGRAGRRRADLCLLRQPDPGRHQQRPRLRALVARSQPGEPEAAAADARGADAPRGGGHHQRRFPEDDPPGWRRLRRQLPA